MLAAYNGHEAAMKVLLQKGADLTVQDQVSEGVSE
jgi:ankyrin repeat protein